MMNVETAPLLPSNAGVSDDTDEAAKATNKKSIVIISSLLLALVGLLCVVSSYNHQRNQPSSVMTTTMMPQSKEEEPSSPHVIEMAHFQLNDNVSCQEFVKHAEKLYDFFHATNDAVQRSLAYSSKNGDEDDNDCFDDNIWWVDLVYWQTMEGARQAAKDIMTERIAQPFLSSINVSTLSLSHSTIQLDWHPLGQGPIVEVAKFPLVHGLSQEQFLEDAKATSPFFEQWAFASKHRILSHGHELQQEWADLVYWTSVEEALAAAKAIEDVPEAQPFLKDMNASSHQFSFQYYHVGLWQDF